MQELHEIAKAYYNAAPIDVKEGANKFVLSMLGEKSKRMMLHQFLEFTKKECLFQMSNPHFFKALCKGENDTLGYWECMTLYYIVQSGRPFCDGCGVFIEGMFFSCVSCFHSKKNYTYNICISCFRGGKYAHDHNLFLDNFLLLERSKLLSECKICKEKNTAPRPTTTSSSQSGPSEIVVYRPQVNAGIMSHLFGTFISAAAQACVIM